MSAPAPAAEGLSLTAFLTCAARAREEALSGDRYAAAWTPPGLAAEVEALREEYAREVCPHEDTGLAVRNRFFLERLRAFAAAHPGAAFANLGAGLTSYPLLVDPPLRALEVDLPALVAAKRARLDELRAVGAVPDCEVRMEAADLSEAEGRARLVEWLAEALGPRPSFVLMEGISYYLAPAALAGVLEAVRRAQAPGSLLALDFWGPEVRGHPVFAALERFYASRLAWREGAYTLLGEGDVRGIAGYRVAALTDCAAERAALLGEAPPSETGSAEGETFLERFAVLRREEGP